MSNKQPLKTWSAHDGSIYKLGFIHWGNWHNEADNTKNATEIAELLNQKDDYIALLESKLDRFKSMLPDAILDAYMQGCRDTDYSDIGAENFVKYKNGQDYYNRTDSPLVKEIREGL